MVVLCNKIVQTILNVISNVTCNLAIIYYFHIADSIMLTFSFFNNLNFPSFFEKSFVASLKFYHFTSLLWVKNIQIYVAGSYRYNR